MKAMKKIQILMLSAVMLFVFAGPAFSAMSTQTTSGQDLIEVFKSAPGTKLSGPLTIYYSNYDSTAKTADMYVFLRLRKGYDLYAFSTIIPSVSYRAGNIDTMTGLIVDFIEDVVIPEIYCPEGEILPPDVEGDPSTCFVEDVVIPDNSTFSPLPTFAIKATDQEIQDDPNCVYCTAVPSIYFAIMDITIAVQD